MARELQTENNALLRLFERFSQQSKIVVISSLALLAALLAMLLSLLAFNDAKHAKIQGELSAQIYSERVDELEEEIAVLGIRVAKWQAWAEANKLEPK